MAQLIPDGKKELSALCDSVKDLTNEGDFQQCELLIADAMSRYPHAPQPHNLMGVISEMRNDHEGAIKHFRAAWSLDPTYTPARQNLDNFASFYIRHEFAFDESDCKKSIEKHSRKF